MVRENVVSHLVVPSTVTSLNHVLKCVCVCVCARMLFSLMFIYFISVGRVTGY